MMDLDDEALTQFCINLGAPDFVQVVVDIDPDIKTCSICSPRQKMEHVCLHAVYAVKKMKKKTIVPLIPGEHAVSTWKMQYSGIKPMPMPSDANLRPMKNLVFVTASRKKSGSGRPVNSAKRHKAAHEGGPRQKAKRKQQCQVCNSFRHRLGSSQGPGHLPGAEPV